MSFFPELLNARTSGRKLFVMLLDPDRIPFRDLAAFFKTPGIEAVDLVLIGSSILINKDLDAYIGRVKQLCSSPVWLFPGNTLQLSNEADGLLLLSLISGRNPDLLIGRHVESAPFIKQSALEVVSTGYMLIDGGKATSASYMSNTTPIPADKPDIAMCTAMAGELLGLKLIYLDAGSGALQAVPAETIRMVRQSVTIPLFVGGGIRTPEQAALALRSGADAVVIGNALEKDPGLLRELAAAVHATNINTVIS